MPYVVTETLFYDILSGAIPGVPADKIVISDRLKSFTDCSFDFAIYIGDSTRVHANSIYFTNCFFSDETTFANVQSIILSGCRFEKSASLNGTKAKLQIVDCVFTASLYLTSVDIIGPFEFLRNQIGNTLHFSGNFKTPIYLVDSSIKEELVLKDCEFLTTLGITNNVIGKININGGSYSGAIKLSNLTLAELQVLNASINDELILMSTTLKIIEVRTVKLLSLLIHDCKIVNTIDLWLQNIEKLYIDKISCGSISFVGKSDGTSYIKITEINTGKLILFKLKNQGLFEFSAIVVTDILDIFSSDLKKMDFINCDFSTAKMSFTNSKVNEIFVAETDFPKLVYSYEKISYQQGQLFFGQLSNAVNTTGDSVKAMEYRSRELYAHYKQLVFFRKSFYFFNLTKFNLWLNYISNDFGRSWGRAVLFSFGLGALFFYIMTVSTSAFKISFPITLDWNLVPAYFRFMNPLRFFETENIYEPLGKTVGLAPRSYVIDFFARVTIAYGFYQVIQAFRRFGKS
ncbi:MAG: hypothetical protein ABI581_09245 [Sediminibacterium sp.]